jgi:GxxExxY protein
MEPVSLLLFLKNFLESGLNLGESVSIGCFLWSKNPGMKLNELTEKIIGAAHNVLFALKPGLDEKLYERALVIELTKQGMRCASQRQFPVYYNEQHIGTLIPDLIVEGLVIVDPKVVAAFNDTHLAQMLGYLNITGLKTALLLNFKQASLGIKRVSN